MMPKMELHEALTYLVSQLTMNAKLNYDKYQFKSEYVEDVMWQQYGIKSNTHMLYMLEFHHIEVSETTLKLLMS